LVVVELEIAVDKVLMVLIQYLEQSLHLVEVEEDKEVKIVPLQTKVEMVVQVVVAVLLLGQMPQNLVVLQ
tara:strand:- start:481 stop:690 length:210 start_codon:yes stop_codon:yes gene_type:complete